MALPLIQQARRPTAAFTARLFWTPGRRLGCLIVLFASWKNTLLPWILFDSLILAVGDRFFLYFYCTHSRTNTSGSHFRINTHKG